MRRVDTFAVLLALAIPSLASAAEHPPLSELYPLLSLPIDSGLVQGIVKKHDLQKMYKFDSGTLTSADHAFTLVFRNNRIKTIVLRVSPWPKGSGEANWTTYSQPLPRKLLATDRRKEIENKLGQPTQPGGDLWIGESMLLWVHFEEKVAAISEVWVSAPPAKL
jgi:hypothetical protein